MGKEISPIMSNSLFDKILPQVMSISEKLSQKYPEGAKVAEHLIAKLIQAPALWASMKERIKAQGLHPEALKAWAQDGKEFVLSNEQVKSILGHELIAKISAKLNTSQEKIIEQAQAFLPLAIGLLQEADARLQKSSVFQWISKTISETFSNSLSSSKPEPSPKSHDSSNTAGDSTNTNSTPSS